MHYFLHIINIQVLYNVARSVNSQMIDQLQKSSARKFTTQHYFPLKTGFILDHASVKFYLQKS